MPMASLNLSQLIPVQSLGDADPVSQPSGYSFLPPLTDQMVLNPHLIWPSILFVCLIVFIALRPKALWGSGPVWCLAQFHFLDISMHTCDGI